MEEPDFFSFLHRFSLICLTETFVHHFDNTNYLNEYQCFTAPAKRLASRGRLSGGVICFIHKSYSNYCENIQHSYDNILAFRIQKELFGMERDILVVGVYIPPRNSSYYESVDNKNGVDMLELCLEEIFERYNECAVILCGDFNARTGNLNTSEENYFEDFRTDSFDR